MQHFASKLLHEDGGRYQLVSCTQSGRRSRRQMMSTKATTLNSEQNVIKVLLLSLHLLVVVHLTQHKLPATLCVAHAHLLLALVVLLLLARRVVPVDRRQHWSCRHHCNYRRSLTEMYVKMSNKSTRLQTDNLQGQFLLKLRAVATRFLPSAIITINCTHYLGTSIYYLDLLKCNWPHPNWTMRGMRIMHKPATMVQICLL